MLLSSSTAGARILKKAELGDSRPVKLPLKQPDEVSAPRPKAEQEAARLEAEEIRTKAYEEGRRQGYQEGIAQAWIEAEQIRNRARSMVREVEEIRRRTLDELENDIRALAVAIAEKLVARQLELDPEYITAVAREVLEVVRERENIVLYAHPSHVVHLQDAYPKLKAALPENAALRIISDAGLEEGGCLVETEQGLVDASRDVRWQEILKALG